MVFDLFPFPALLFFFLFSSPCFCKKKKVNYDLSRHPASLLLLQQLLLLNEAPRDHTGREVQEAANATTRHLLRKVEEERGRRRGRPATEEVENFSGRTPIIARLPSVLSARNDAPVRGQACSTYRIGAIRAIRGTHARLCALSRGARRGRPSMPFAVEEEVERKKERSKRRGKKKLFFFVFLRSLSTLSPSHHSLFSTPNSNRKKTFSLPAFSLSKDTARGKQNRKERKRRRKTRFRFHS